MLVVYKNKKLFREKRAINSRFFEKKPVDFNKIGLMKTKITPEYTVKTKKNVA